VRLFYNLSKKQLLEAKNELFVRYGIPALRRNNFQQSPFAADWFGRNNLGDYTYKFCRLNSSSHLETITTHICKDDKWVQMFLNVFEVKPSLQCLEQLQVINGLQYNLVPNKLTSMRLREDDFKGIPLFNTVHHKLDSFYTKNGFKTSVKKLSNLIESDLNNINEFISRWHELHTPLITNWEGETLPSDDRSKIL